MLSFGRLPGQNRPHGIEGNDLLHQGIDFPLPFPLSVAVTIRLGRFLVP
jgi:hypothetical protein